MRGIAIRQKDIAAGEGSFVDSTVPHSDGESLPLASCQYPGFCVSRFLDR
jgi:hypothetical protein